MNDFEKRLKDLLAQQVDHETGPRRQPPPFTVRPARRVRTTWTLPLLAAACVVALVAGGVGVSALVAGRDRSPAVGPTPSSITPTQAPSAVATTGTPTAPVTGAPTAPRSHASGAPNTVPAAGATSATTVDDGWHTVTLGGARVALPAGWVARDLSQYFGSGGSSIYPGWCLGPASVPVDKEGGTGCRAKLTTVTRGEDQLDPETAGGNVGNPHYCMPGQEGPGKEQEADRRLGGRAADWRHWTYTCTTGKVTEVEQYVVPTSVAWILFSDKASTSVSQVLAGIATRSTLPVQSAPLRLFDRGYLRSIRRDGGVVHVTLDRVAGPNVNKNPATYPYDVPLAQWQAEQASSWKVGSYAVIRTDGSKVTSISHY